MAHVEIKAFRQHRYSPLQYVVTHCDGGKRTVLLGSLALRNTNRKYVLALAAKQKLPIEHISETV